MSGGVIQVIRIFMFFVILIFMILLRAFYGQTCRVKIEVKTKKIQRMKY